MSATILDHEKLGRYLGIDKGDIRFIRVDESSFPVENRPIHQDYCGRATAKTMDKYLPKMLRKIDEYYIPTMKKYKGIVHTHSHVIARYILEHSKHSSIMISNTDNERKREDVFQEFFDSDSPKIMVSPSMSLGVDLFDDRCRWALLVKMPYPYLGDPQVRRRMKVDPDWYDYNTLCSLIQCYGRTCRSIDDWADTYILDSMFVWLISRNKDTIPRWFMEAIRKVPK